MRLTIQKKDFDWYEGCATSVPTSAVKRLGRLWFSLMRRHFPDVPLAPWFSSTGRPWKPAKTARTLLRIYPDGAEAVEIGLRYMVKRWPMMQDRFSRAPMFPTFEYFAAIHDCIVPEACSERRNAGHL